MNEEQLNSFCASVTGGATVKERRDSVTCSVSTRRRKTLLIEAKYSTNRGLQG